MTPAWADLPNAHHINRVLAHLFTYPTQWITPSTETISPVRDRARKVAQDITQNFAWGPARYRIWKSLIELTRNTTLGTAWVNMWDISLALIAYDDCGYILELPLGAVKVMVSADIPVAALLNPAILIMRTQNDPRTRHALSVVDLPMDRAQAGQKNYR